MSQKRKFEEISESSNDDANDLSPDSNVPGSGSTATTVPEDEYVNSVEITPPLEKKSRNAVTHTTHLQQPDGSFKLPPSEGARKNLGPEFDKEAKAAKSKAGGFRRKCKTCKRKTCKRKTCKRKSRNCKTCKKGSCKHV